MTPPVINTTPSPHHSQVSYLTASVHPLPTSVFTIKLLTFSQIHTQVFTPATTPFCRQIQPLNETHSADDISSNEEEMA